MTTSQSPATRDDYAAATFAPIITADQIKIIDGLLCGTEGVVRRRTPLYLLTRSDTELEEIARRDPEKTMDLADDAKPPTFSRTPRSAGPVETLLATQ